MKKKNRKRGPSPYDLDALSDDPNYRKIHGWFDPHDKPNPYDLSTLPPISKKHLTK